MKIKIRYSIIILLSFQIFMIGGCARFIIKTTYDNIDRIAIYRLDGYFDLRSAQEDSLREKIRELHRIHRKTHLPLYAETLKKIKEKAGGGLAHQDVEMLFREMENFRRRLYELVIPAASGFLSTLNDEQVDYFEEELKESNEERIDALNRPPDERFEERYEKSLNFYERIYGGLTAKQKVRLKALNTGLPDIHALRIEYNLKFQGEFISLLRSKPQIGVIESRLREWFITDHYAMTPEYGKILGEWRTSASKLHAKMQGVLTEEQKNHAGKEIETWIEDIDELIADEWIF